MTCGLAAARPDPTRNAKGARRGSRSTFAEWAVAQDARIEDSRGWRVDPETALAGMAVGMAAAAALDAADDGWARRRGGVVVRPYGHPATTPRYSLKVRWADAAHRQGGFSTPFMEALAGHAGISAATPHGGVAVEFQDVAAILHAPALSSAPIEPIHADAALLARAAVATRGLEEDGDTGIVAVALALRTGGFDLDAVGLDAAGLDADAAARAEMDAIARAMPEVEGEVAIWKTRHGARALGLACGPRGGNSRVEFIRDRDIWQTLEVAQGAVQPWYALLVQRAEACVQVHGLEARASLYVNLRYEPPGATLAAARTIRLVGEREALSRRYADAVAAIAGTRGVRS